jgi:three-Cys-motif partner protein
MEPVPSQTAHSGQTILVAGRQVTTTGPLQFDEIGRWSELKLEIIEKYGAAYTSALRNARNLKKFYIDGYCGPGVHVSRRTREPVEGSPARALRVLPPFDGFYFVDMDVTRTSHLETLCKGRNDVVILTGDANVKLTQEVLPKIHFHKFNRALCLLDPYGLHLDWEVVFLAGQSQAIDMFLNFPVMDMNRNAIWRNPKGVPQDGIERMTRFWGDESWKKVAYLESAQGDLFLDPPLVKQDNDAIVSAFRDRLKNVAGFKYVLNPLPMKNSNNTVVYYLFLASQKAVAEKIIRDIFAKYR